MVGADPSEANIEVARKHAALVDLRIDYRAVTAEELADKGERFDVVLALEVVEHVADVDLFVRRCAEMVRPNGMMIAATINRTMKSLLLAKIGAEYVLRWLPRGTHRWDKFVTPAELEAAMQKAGLNVVDERGVVYRVMSDSWALSDDMDVNYMLSATRERISPIADSGIAPKSYPPCLQSCDYGCSIELQEPAMIVELVTFTFPKGHDRASELEAVRGVIGEMGGEPGTGAQAFPVGRRRGRRHRRRLLYLAFDRGGQTRA